MNNDLQKFKKCDVFTPQHISNLMASKLHKTGTLLEPSAGIGNLLQPIDINAYTQIDVYELKTEYLDLIKYTKKLVVELDVAKDELNKVDDTSTNTSTNISNNIINNTKNTVTKYKIHIIVTFLLVVALLIYIFIIKSNY